MCHSQELPKLPPPRQLQALPLRQQQSQKRHGRSGLPQAFLNDGGPCSCAARSTSDRQPHLSSTAISCRQSDGISPALDQYFQRNPDGMDPIPLQPYKKDQNFLYQKNTHDFYISEEAV